MFVTFCNPVLMQTIEKLSLLESPKPTYSHSPPTSDPPGAESRRSESRLLSPELRFHRASQVPVSCLAVGSVPVLSEHEQRRPDMVHQG